MQTKGCLGLATSPQSLSDALACIVLRQAYICSTYICQKLAHVRFHVRFDTIEDAITDIKNGKIIIVVDDENRENEG